MNKFIILMVAAGSLATGASSAHAGQCGFFDLLFGCAEPRVIDAPSPAHVRRRAARPAIVFESSEKPRASAGAAKKMPLAAKAGETVGSLAMFRRDDTLRTGDIVTTPEGFFEYRGGAFRPVNTRRTASPGLRLASSNSERLTRTAEQGIPR